VLLEQSEPFTVMARTLLAEEVVVVVEVAVEVEALVELELPPEPPQPEQSIIAKNRNGNLLDLINGHPRWNQGRNISPALQVAHVAPFLDNNVIRLNALPPNPLFTRSVLQSCFEFTGIGAQQGGQIRMHQSIPGNREYYTR
jgi:hypothetical protein